MSRSAIIRSVQLRVLSKIGGNPYAHLPNQTPERENLARDFCKGLSVEKKRLKTLEKPEICDFAGEANELLIRRSQVRVLPGVPVFSKGYNII